PRHRAGRLRPLGRAARPGPVLQPRVPDAGRPHAHRRPRHRHHDATRDRLARAAGRQRQAVPADVPAQGAAPATLFDDHPCRTPAASHTEMQIDRDLTLHYDLMVPPTDAERRTLQDPDSGYDAMMQRMTPAQQKAWDAAFAAENA